MADLETLLRDLAGPVDPIDAEQVRRRVDRRRRERRNRRVGWLGAAAAILVALVTVAAIAAPHDTTLQVGDGSAATSTTVRPVPTASQLAELARRTPALVPPAGGFQRLRTVATSTGYKHIGGEPGVAPAVETMTTRRTVDQWVAADGSGRTLTVQTELDVDGRPKAEQVIGFDLPFSSDQATGEVVWGADALAAVPSEAGGLNDWLQAAALLGDDARPERLPPLVAARLLAWPATPPPVRARVIEWLGERPDLRIERSTVGGRPVVRLSFDEEQWLALDEADNGLVAFGSAGSTTVIEIREISGELPASIDPPTSAELSTSTTVADPDPTGNPGAEG